MSAADRVVVCGRRRSRREGGGGGGVAACVGLGLLEFTWDVAVTTVLIQEGGQHRKKKPAPRVTSKQRRRSELFVLACDCGFVSYASDFVLDSLSLGRDVPDFVLVQQS